MTEQEIIILKALFEKIFKDPNSAFFCKQYITTGLLNWNYIENLINDCYRLTAAEIELIDHDKTKHKYPLIQGSWMIIPRPDPKYIINKINKGYSLVILGGSRINKDINIVCQLIESIIPKTAVDVHAYCGLKGSKSFTAHFDFADNIIIHQSGSCHWKIYKQRAEDCDNKLNVDGKTLDIEFETIINPGDLIYVPKFQYHECIPLEKRISLSFPIAKGTSIDRNWYKIK